MGKILFPDYFPTCPTDGSDYVVPGYTAVLTSTFSETMNMFWRPKKIKVSGSYLQFNEESRLCNIFANFELIIQSPYGSEEEMCCEPVKPWTLASSTNVEDPELAFFWDSNPLYYGGQDALFTFNRFDFQLSNLSGNCDHGVFIEQLYTVEREGEAGPFDYELTNILGCDFNMATYVDEFEKGFIQPAIEVTEWWSFGGTYDTRTGAKL
jgi:hypothetical protein